MKSAHISLGAHIYEHTYEFLSTYMPQSRLYILPRRKNMVMINHFKEVKGFSKGGENKSNTLKKRVFPHYFSTNIYSSLGTKTIKQKLKGVKNLKMKMIYDLYWILIGKFLGPYQYTKFSPINLVQLHFTKTDIKMCVFFLIEI